MANRSLTADVIAKEAVTILENNLVMGNLVYRGYEEEFDKKVNGYQVGDTISIRRPADFTVTDGATLAVQDAQEGKFSLQINKRKHVAFKFTSQDLTLSIEKLSERIIQPAMIQLANQVDRDIMALYDDVANHVTIPSGGINSFADFALALERMDVTGLPQDGRSAVLSPSDHWAMLGAQTALFIQDAAKDAYRRGRMGMIGGCDTYMSQLVPTHTTGTRTGTDLVDQALVDGTITWASTRDTGTQTLHIDGTNGATDTLTAGDVFTISDVYDVNPVTKEVLPHLKHFVVTALATMSGNEGDLTIAPPVILSGAHKTCHLSSGTEINDNTVTYKGTASTGFAQNLFFCKNAFALCMVPLVKPPGAVDVGRQSYKGVSVRVIPVYDGNTDESTWRCDVLYGVKTVDQRLAVRASLMADVA